MRKDPLESHSLTFHLTEQKNDFLSCLFSALVSFPSIRYH
jgi:hypothetical protein